MARVLHTNKSYWAIGGWCGKIDKTTSTIQRHTDAQINERNRALGHLCAHIGWTGPREPPEDGEMITDAQSGTQCHTSYNLKISTLNTFPVFGSATTSSHTLNLNLGFKVYELSNVEDVFFTFNNWLQAGPGRYSDRSLFRQLDIPTGRCSDRSIFRQTGRYSDRSLFRQVDIPTGRYSDRSIFRQTGRYSDRSIVRQTGRYSDRSIVRQTDKQGRYSERSIFRHKNNSDERINHY